MLAEDFRRRHDTERALGLALIDRASQKSNIIRKRLAAVAEELRQAAATAGTGSEGLLRLATKFEQNSKPGDKL